MNCVDVVALGFAIGFRFCLRFDSGVDFGAGDDLFGLWLLALEALEIGGGDLQRVENEAGFFVVDSVLKDEFNDLPESELDCVRVFKNGQGEFRLRAITI
ncbi:MAG: hypothetical protein WAU58_15795 [Terriglobales bacterium]